VIVDQVGHHDAKAGLKTTEQIVSLFGSCLLIIGTSFHSKNEVGIYGSGNQGRAYYFIFGEPYNEDEVISYLKLYKSSEGSHPDVDEQILNELIASYHIFKENERGMEEEEEENETGMEEEEQDPSSLWIRFREVTGFVPLSCWKIIERDEDYEDTLEERLDRINREIISEVMAETLLFYEGISTTSKIMSQETQSFLEMSRDNYLTKMQSMNGNDAVLNDGTVERDFRVAWDLRYVSCLYNNTKHRMSTPIALSGSIAAGLHKVF